MLDYHDPRWARAVQRALRSRQLIIHLLIIATIAAIGGWTATGMLLWMLATARGS